ncbi:MAG: hypothetical protein ACRDQ5_25315 [Sciscionella sp.]
MDTAAEVVVAVPAGDDTGARTADLYDWQAAMATADGLRLFADALDADGHLPPDADGRIICEHHEDWTVLNAPDAELVSAKHREPSSGAWTTVKQLVDKGGLAHLFGRWLALDEKPTVRLVTCAALAPGDPRKLAKVTALLRDQATGSELDAPTVTLVNEVAMGFAKELLLHRDGLPKEWQAPAEATAKTCVVSDAHGQKVCLFLAVLFIDDRRPHREVTDHAAPSMYMQPVLGKLDRRDVPALAVWEAVLQLFRVRTNGAKEAAAIYARCVFHARPEEITELLVILFQAGDPDIQGNVLDTIDTLTSDPQQLNSIQAANLITAVKAQ